MIITFCGHSNFKANKNDEIILLNLLEEISKGKPIDFYLGGYGNFDLFVKNCVKKFKANHPNVNVIFVTPYLNKWLDNRKDYLKREYDKIVYPEIESVPLKFAILKRNEWMVNQADYLICYVSTHYGGAYNTLLYAHKHNKPYINLYKGDYELY